MPFIKGQSGNANGRKVGSTNKLPLFHREFIQTLLDGQQERITDELSQLQGKEYFAAINGLIEYVLPKLSRQELHTNFNAMDENQLDDIINKLKENQHD